MMERGAVYQSYGTRYADQAAASAASVKRTNPWLKTALFTEDVEYAANRHSAVFDHIIPLVDSPEAAELLELLRSNKWLYSIKIMASHRSPFEQTLLIDSDTQVLRDLTTAFELLDHFDLMLCNEVEHHYDEHQNAYSGLIDDRRMNFFNSGVIFSNSYKSEISSFFKEWENIQRNGDPILQRTDQDSLNHMLALPTHYMNGIRFSSSALKSRNYNAFCRSWRHIWDSGLWDEVRIIHSFMAESLGPQIADGTIDWEAIITDEVSENGRFINRFRPGWTGDAAKRFAEISTRSNVSIRQFVNCERRSLGKSEAEDKAILYSMTPEDTGVKLTVLLHSLKAGGRIAQGCRITQIGMMSTIPSLPMHNRNTSFAVGNDLEYLADLFDADVTGISRSSFLNFRGHNCKTQFIEYALKGNIDGVIEANQDLIIDIDNSISPPTRIRNALEAAKSLKVDGILLIANINPDVASRIGERLKPHFTVSIIGGALVLTRKGVVAPVYIADYTPFSVARIALVGNCQSSAIASTIYRVKGVKVDIVADINAEGTEAFEHAKWAVAHEDRVDFCFSQPLGESFGGIRSERLRRKYGSRFKQFTNLYFTGYHPDLTYYGSRGVRLQSAMGDYNSRIALIGYLQGRSLKNTLGLFNEDVYEKLGFFTQFEASKAELIQRDQSNDVRFAERFFDVAKTSLVLYTVNHPTAHALAPLAQMIVEACGLTVSEISTEFVRNPLIDGSIWPVYPEVASKLGLDYRGGTVFYPSFHEQRPPMELADFIATTFERYDDFGREKIEQMPGSQDLAKTAI